jgi:hypothetical protein
MSKLFKSLGKIFETDNINRLWVKRLPDGTQEEYTLEDWYSDIEAIKLSEKVPKDIQEQFDAAKNVLLYSWFSYRLRMVALLYSFTVVENALRKRLGYNKDEWKGLKCLLIEAIEKGLFNDSGFHIPKFKVTVVSERRHNDVILREVQYSEIPEEELKQSAKYIEGLCEAIPSLRNTLAHGNICIFSEVLTPIIVNSEIINMLFGESNDNKN